VWGGGGGGGGWGGGARAHASRRREGGRLRAAAPHQAAVWWGPPRDARAAHRQGWKGRRLARATGQPLRQAAQCMGRPGAVPRRDFQPCCHPWRPALRRSPRQQLCHPAAGDLGLLRGVAGQGCWQHQTHPGCPWGGGSAALRHRHGWGWCGPGLPGRPPPHVSSLALRSWSRGSHRWEPVKSAAAVPS
jgi:hypothetical protein